MSDMYGAVRSNSFKVKNVEAFRAWFDNFVFGNEIEFWVNETNEDGSGTVSFGGYEQYPTAYPRYRVYEDPEATGEDDWFDIEEVPELDAWASELRMHLVDGEVFQVVACGNEKMRYVSYSELLVAQDIEKPVWTCVYTDDDQASLRKRMKPVYSMPFA